MNSNGSPNSSSNMANKGGSTTNNYSARSNNENNVNRNNTSTSNSNIHRPTGSWGSGGNSLSSRSSRDVQANNSTSGGKSSGGVNGSSNTGRNASRATSNPNGNASNGGNRGTNHYRNNGNQNFSPIKNKIQEMKKQVARKAIVDGANAVVPGAGMVADQALKTEQGNELLDTYAQASTPAEGIKEVVAKITKKQQNRNYLAMILAMCAPILILTFLVGTVFKNADTQTYSEDPDKLQEATDDGYKYTESENPNVFNKYKDLYDYVEKKADEIGKQYGVNIDKNLILATLIAPVENGDVMQAVDGESQSDKMYVGPDGKKMTWAEIIESMQGQVELLAKSQMIAYVASSSSDGQYCNGTERTMEQYSKNDRPVGEEWSFWNIFNPFKWGANYRSAADAELNAYCVSVEGSDIPNTYALSIEAGTFYYVGDDPESKEPMFIKDPNSGGVYFWNLVNPSGFIATYYKNYLTQPEGKEGDDAEKAQEEFYKANIIKILEYANYIYKYYDSTKDTENYCYNGYKVIEKPAEGQERVEGFTVKVKDPDTGTTKSYELEDYVAGVIAAEFSPSVAKSPEALKAFSILARTYGYNKMKSSGSVENSSNNQNFNESGITNPEIRSIVDATRGLVLTKANTDKIFSSEYDAFCPTTSTATDFFRLMPGQRSLPIDAAWVNSVVPQTYLDCPCEEPLSALAKCYKASGEYKPSGGHGRGASQYGLRYFGEKGYTMEHLLKLFDDREGNRVKIAVLDSSLVGGFCNDSVNPSYDLTYSGEVKVTESKTILNETLEQLLNRNGSSLKEFSDLIKKEIDKNGVGTRQGVVAAAVTLIQTLDESYGFRLPYYYTGGHSSETIGDDIIVRGNWGGFRGPYTNNGITYTQDGMDCSGFVAWALYHGGYKYSSKSADSWSKEGTKTPISNCRAQIGDLLWREGHVMLIVGQNESKDGFLVAHAAGKNYGIYIQEISCNNNSRDYVIDMNSWYSRNKR